jgi:hypothetical protein
MGVTHMQFMTFSDVVLLTSVITGIVELVLAVVKLVIAILAYKKK